ncbi:hypothetical protein Bca101_051179 [Brassica carinata]
MVEMIEVPDRMFADGEEPVGVRVLAYHRSSGIRMLRKKTVVDKEIRIKYALLALVSSVLMPTNLKSKIPKEYVEMIKDLNQFLSFPWGRLAFDMLMTSIKERDEVTLCQNTFALKGFVHAMQLVMVEAVPALTEVVQEAGSSSSESDSDREDGDLHEKRNKRLKLSPGHARDVDHKCEVPVKCIIGDDSIHPVDNEYEDYSDEKTDQKIENRKGKKKDKKTGKKSASPETISDSKVATLLYDKMKPEISRFHETTKNLDATVKAATEEFASMESLVGTLVESKIKSMIESVMVPMIEQELFQMKGDIIQSIETMITNQHQDPIINSKSQPSSVQDHYNSDPTSNDTENVAPQCLRTERLEMSLRDPFSFIENPSFALGLSQEEKQDHTDGRSSQEPESVEEDSHDKLPQRRKSLRLRNFLNSTLPQSTSVEQISEMELFPVIEIPSFSLSLSHEDNNDDLVNGLAAEQVAVEKDNPFDLQECRRGKRQKTVTHGLVDVFQYSPDILNRARESQLAVYGKADSWEYTQKYTKLAQKLKSHFVIHLGGCQVSNKDIIDIVERAKPYSSKVMDVLMKHLSLSYANQSLSEESKKSVFLDSNFVASLSRNYSKLSKIQAKETHVFTKGLVEVFGEMVDHFFDCNTSLRSEASMSSELKPISEIFPYLMKQAGWRISNSQLVPMVVETAKIIPQNIISADSSLTSVLLMQTYALSGIEACRCITPHILASEAQRVAVLLYEYHMKL